MNEFKDQWRVWHKVGNIIGCLALLNMLTILICAVCLNSLNGRYITIFSFVFMILLLFLSVAITSRGDWLFARAKDEHLRVIYEQENTCGMGI